MELVIGVVVVVRGKGVKVGVVSGEEWLGSH